MLSYLGKCFGELDTTSVDSAPPQSTSIVFTQTLEKRFRLLRTDIRQKPRILLHHGSFFLAPGLEVKIRHLQNLQLEEKDNFHIQHTRTEESFPLRKTYRARRGCLKVHLRSWSDISIPNSKAEFVDESLNRAQLSTPELQILGDSLRSLPVEERMTTEVAA